MEGQVREQHISSNNSIGFCLAQPEPTVKADR